MYLKAPYDAPSAAKPAAPETPYPRRFTGVSGLRYYKPGLGRWPSRDPTGMNSGKNWFAFIGNEPVADVDVLGMYLFRLLVDTEKQEKIDEQRWVVLKQWYKCICIWGGYGWQRGRSESSVVVGQVDWYWRTEKTYAEFEYVDDDDLSAWLEVVTAFFAGGVPSPFEIGGSVEYTPTTHRRYRRALKEEFSVQCNENTVGTMDYKEKDTSVAFDFGVWGPAE